MVRILILFLFSVLVSCSHSEKKNDSRHLTSKQKELIKAFALDLKQSINKYEYEMIRNAWDDDLFKRRITPLSRTERNILNGFYEEGMGKKVLYANIDLVNKLKQNNGSMSLSKILYYPSHAEIIVTLKFGVGVDFLKYRIDFKNGVPKLSDYYSFKDDFWQSENIRDIVRLSITHTAVSPERHQANRSIFESEKSLRQGDSLQALMLLYDVPQSHMLGNALSIRRINLAYEMGDSLFASAIVSERELNESTYIRYLYGYYFNDTTELSQVFKELDSKLGINNNVLDSLKGLNYFWN